MDGLHLADVELSRLGRRDWKGAPDTFDGFGFLALLRRLRTPRRARSSTRPRSSARIEQPIAGSIPVGPDVPLIITEGNYLLLDDPPWHEVRPLLDETWFVEIDDAVRVDRLIRRHIEFGKTPEQAAEWVHRLDEQNARLVAATRERGRCDRPGRLAAGLDHHQVDQALVLGQVDVAGGIGGGAATAAACRSRSGHDQPSNRPGTRPPTSEPGEP